MRLKERPCGLRVGISFRFGRNSCHEKSLIKYCQTISYEAKRRGRDSNPRYKFKLVQRFSKPALSATQAPLLWVKNTFKGDAKITINSLCFPKQR